MSVSLSASLTAIIPGLKSSFLAIGGTGPYVYSVRANGAGGTINASTGIYSAPAVMGSSPETIYDTIQARDALGAIATAQILIGTPLFLFCDIIQKFLGLAPGRVYLWDQKIMQPTDSDLYVAVSMPMCRPFGNNAEHDSSGNLVLSTNLLATLDLDIISRGPAARDRKEQVIMALMSDYSRAQQEANSFMIGRISKNFINLSMVDGAAIPYRFRISVQIQYAVTNTIPAPYFNTFTGPTVATNP